MENLKTVSAGMEKEVGEIQQKLRVKFSHSVMHANIYFKSYLQLIRIKNKAILKKKFTDSIQWQEMEQS